MKFGSITTGIIADGLIWNMDAANRASYVPNATTSFSTINSGNSGSFEGTPIFVTQPTSASCWQFDGVDDYITCGRNINPTFPGGTANTVTDADQKFTMNIWFKHGGVTAIPVTLPMSYVNTYHGFRALSIGYFSSRIQVNCRYIVTVKADGTTWQVGEWGNLCVTYTGGTIASTDSWKIYVNGIDQGVIASTNHTGTNYRKSTALGAYGNEASPYYQEVEISCCQLYDRPLSASEVLHNYNALKGRFGL